MADQLAEAQLTADQLMEAQLMVDQLTGARLMADQLTGAQLLADHLAPTFLVLASWWTQQNDRRPSWGILHGHRGRWGRQPSEWRHAWHPSVRTLG